MKYIYLTREGYEKLRKEYERLTRVKRREIADQLEQARMLGDLKENAEYDAAKNAQAVMEKRIAELENSLSSVKILDDEKIDKNKALLGATVTLKDLDTDGEVEYTLVNAEESDLALGKISITSPVGKAILGHKVGDKISIEVPAGTLEYKLTKITR
ncbi:MAG: transcription elongation factor GreA [Candidatus Omnitrophota bacterium]